MLDRNRINNFKNGFANKHLMTKIVNKYYIAFNYFYTEIIYKKNCFT